MTYHVYRQKTPNPVNLGLCCLSMDVRGQLLVMDSGGKTVIESAVRARVEWLHVAGMMVSGFVQTGVESNGKPTYEHAEWFCSYVKEPK